MATATKIHTSVPVQVDEYQCEDCGGLFVMMVIDKPSYCPHCGESVEIAPA